VVQQISSVIGNKLRNQPTFLGVASHFRTFYSIVSTLAFAESSRQKLGHLFTFAYTPENQHGTPNVMCLVQIRFSRSGEWQDVANNTRKIIEYHLNATKS